MLHWISTLLNTFPFSMRWTLQSIQFKSSWSAPKKLQGIDSFGYFSSEMGILFFGGWLLLWGFFFSSCFILVNVTWVYQLWCTILLLNITSRSSGWKIYIEAYGNWGPWYILISLCTRFQGSVSLKYSVCLHSHTAQMPKAPRYRKAQMCVKWPFYVDYKETVLSEYGL